MKKLVQMIGTILFCAVFIMIGTLLFCAVFTGCYLDNGLQQQRMDGGSADVLATNAPDLVPTSDHSRPAFVGCNGGGSTTRLIDVGKGADPILLANATGYALAINGEAPRVYFLSPNGESYMPNLYLPSSLPDCPFQGQTCKGRNGGPFRFLHGAAEPDGFILDIETEYYADLVVKVGAQRFTRLVKDPNSGFTFGFGGAIFTDDGAYAVTLAGPGPYSNVQVRTATTYEPLQGLTYGIDGGEGSAEFSARSAAHIGSTVAFGVKTGLEPTLGIMDTDKKTIVTAKLASDPIYPVRRVRRVMRVRDSFAVLEQDAHAPNDFDSSVFILSRFHPDGSGDGFTYVLNEQDIVAVSTGFVGVRFDPKNRNEIGFQMHDDRFKVLELHGQTFLTDMSAPIELPMIACVDNHHCAAAWKSKEGIYLSVLVCH